MKKLLVSIAAFLSFQYAGLCSDHDTIPVPKVFSYRFNYDFTKLDSIPVDTLLSLFEIYNPAFQNRAQNLFLGNLTSPYQSLLFSDFHLSSDPFFAKSTAYDSHQPNNTLYYRAKRPYTIINYFANFPGMRDEQKMNIIHTQNINRNFNVGVSVDLNSSNGSYTSQLDKANAFSFFTTYMGKRYSISGNANLNKISLTENGGLLPGQNLNNISNLTQIAMNLSNAGSVLKDQSISFIQRFYITGSYKADSLNTGSRWNEAVSLIHQFTYQRITRNYTDYLNTSDSSFYRNYFKFSPNQTFGFNQDTTIDSLYFRHIENIVQLAVNANQWLKIPAELRFGVKNQIDKLNTYAFDSMSSVASNVRYFMRTTGMDEKGKIVNPDFLQYIVNDAFVASLTNRFSKATNWGASGEYYFTGYKSGNLILNGDLSQFIGPNFVMHLSGTLANVRPGYFLNTYTSNHIHWHTDFKSQQSSSINFRLDQLKHKFSIDFRWDNLNNYVYFDTLAKPVAASHPFMVYALTLSKNIDWGIFHSSFRLTFQRSENDRAIAIPKFSGFNSTHLAFGVFQNALLLQMGFDIFYNSRFYASSYAPFTSVFFAQTSRLIDNMPYTDVFLNMRIKRTRFFFKYEHIDGYLFNKHEYFIPNYLMNPPLLKFGISWTFYN